MKIFGDKHWMFNCRTQGGGRTGRKMVQIVILTLHSHSTSIHTAGLSCTVSLRCTYHTNGRSGRRTDGHRVGSNRRYAFGVLHRNLPQRELQMATDRLHPAFISCSSRRLVTRCWRQCTSTKNRTFCRPGGAIVS